METLKRAAPRTKWESAGN